MYQYKTEQFLPIEIDKAWKFFSSPENLSLITPPEMGFEILTNLSSEEIYEGMKIDYKVKPLFGIPLRWQTEISKVYNQNIFIDKQVKGPYKVWEHTHTFTKTNGGVLMTDEVNYQLPFSFLGDIAHLLLVKRKIKDIFTYRRKVLESLFITNGNHTY